MVKRYCPIAFLGAFLSVISLAGPPQVGKVFTFRMTGEPETLDWNRAHTPIETYILLNIMEGLVGFDAQLKVIPKLATSWTQSADHKTYTFKIRKGVKWTDGVELKAKDFAYSWKRLLAPATAAAYAYFLFDIQGAEEFNKGKLRNFDQVGVKALDDYTLEVKLAKPVSHWLYIPTFWVTFPVRQDVVEKFGEGWERPGRVVTLGPYRFVSHEMDTKIVLKANPGYYGSRGNIDEIDGIIVRDDSTALTLYESGKFDFLTDIATIDLKRLGSRKDLRAFPYLKTGYIGFVTTKYPVSNPRLRKAIALAIDKKHLGDILHGGQVMASTFVPPSLVGYSKTIGLSFDVIKAKAELRASGVDINRQVKLELLCPNADKQVTLAQFVQGELKKNLGIDVSIQPFDNKTFRAQLDLHAFPMMEGSWSADFPDPDNFLSIFMSDVGNNRTAFKNKSYDDLVNRARNVTNEKVREALYFQAQKVLQEEEVAIIPLYYEPQMALVKDRVHGLALNPLNYLDLKNVILSP